MRALLSVSDKRGLDEFGQGLAALGWRIVASGGTAAALRAAGVDVEPLPGRGEWLEGRVKTLQASVHAGILARRDRPQDLNDLGDLGSEPIDLVAVNLYPFRESPDIETIDIGGVALLRGAAKNWRWVASVSDPADYGAVLEELRAGALSDETRRRLARKAFAHTAAYDASIARWLGHEPLAQPEELTLTWRRVGELRYGENPHQGGAVYRDALPGRPSLLDAAVLQGKALSYNNWLDAAAAWELAGSFGEPCAVAVKHAGPCGVAVGADLHQAYLKCHEADPVSIFGGIVAVNGRLTADVAEELAKIFLEVVLAPEVTGEARSILAKKKNLRVLEAPAPEPGGYRLRSLPGGVLVQQADSADDPAGWEVVSKRPPEDLADARFAWTVVRSVASNAIVLARDGMTVGIGGGQPNRVGAAEIALRQAGEKARGAALVSDGFFFPDTVEAAVAGGVALLISPGGSRQDAEVIAAADRAGLPLVFTHVRHFRH